jgi:hypothetical protein
MPNSNEHRQYFLHFYSILFISRIDVELLGQKQKFLDIILNGNNLHLNGKEMVIFDFSLNYECIQCINFQFSILNSQLGNNLL